MSYQSLLNYELRMSNYELIWNFTEFFAYESAQLRESNFQFFPKIIRNVLPDVCDFANSGIFVE